MLSVLYACLICINFNKYIHTLIKQIFDGSPSHTLYIKKKKLCGAVNLCICIYIYVVIVIGVLGFGYTRSALNIYYCKYI